MIYPFSVHSFLHEGTKMNYNYTILSQCTTSYYKLEKYRHYLSKYRLCITGVILGQYKTSKK